MNNKLIRNFSIAGFILIVLAVIIIPKLKSDKVEEGPAATGGRRGGIVPVTIKVMTPKSFTNTINITGSILSNEEVELRPEVSGKITSILFKEGMKVTKGDLLVKVNDADLQAQLQKAEIKQQLAQDKEFRQKTLLSKNGISQETYDIALNDLNSAKADVNNIKALIQKTEIHAPFNGTIGLRYVSEGSYVTTSTKIATLQNLNPVKIDFSIPQRFAGSITVGNPIVITTPGGKQYNAKIYAIEPKIDPATRALLVRGISPNDKGELIPGASINVKLSLDDIKNALTVPTQALALDITGERVFVYKKGTAVPVLVQSGVRTEEEVQIVSGLKVGDSVITSGIMQIRPRAKVRIMNQQKEK